MSLYPVKAQRLSIGSHFRLRHRKNEICRLAGFDSVYRIFVAFDATGMPFQLKPKTLVFSKNNNFI